MLKLTKPGDVPKEKAVSTKFILSTNTLPLENTTEQYIPVHISGQSPAQTINELGKEMLRAAADGNVEEIRWLLSKGATFTADWLGTSPLHLAAQNNHQAVCELLLRAGISADARTKVDKTPMHLAAYEGHNDIVETLIKHGANCDARDLLGMTPLHWAVQNGHIDVAATLKRNGCQTDVTNKFDLTPADIAHQMGRHDIIDLMNARIDDPLTSVQSLALELTSTDNSNESTAQAPCDNSLPETIPLETVLLEDMENDQSNEADCDTNSQPESEDISMEESMELNDQDDTFSESIKLLQEHGITLLPTDDSSILESVMESGHSVVLTDVGKEMLHSVKQQEQMKAEAPTIKVPENRKVITLTPDEFVALTNGTLSRANLLGKLNRKIVPKTMKRVVMKKNKIIPVSSLTSSAIQLQAMLKDGSDMETVMTQLIEARKTIEEYKIKLQKKEQEAERYKQQLKLLMDAS